MIKGDNIQERLVDFAVVIIQLCAELPQNVIGRHIAGQLMRSGTSPAPNYAEARSAESNNDFVHKLKISLKELNETSVWLKIIVRSKLLSKERVHNVYGECNELCKIISSSIRTVVDKRRK